MAAYKKCFGVYLRDFMEAAASNNFIIIISAETVDSRISLLSSSALLLFCHLKQKPAPTKCLAKKMVFVAQQKNVRKQKVRESVCAGCTNLPIILC